MADSTPGGPVRNAHYIGVEMHHDAADPEPTEHDLLEAVLVADKHLEAVIADLDAAERDLENLHRTLAEARERRADARTALAARLNMADNEGPKIAAGRSQP